MTTFYCSDSDSKWIALEDDVNLREFALTKLQEEAGLDSDSGYYAYYEFWRDGELTYGFAEYDGWSNYYNLYGDLNLFEYGSLDYIRTADSWFSNRVTPNKYSPIRDYIKISR